MPGTDPEVRNNLEHGQRVAAAALAHEISRWREQLARSIARNNLALRSAEIATAVNRILFALLLYRFAEDRGLIPGGTLAGIAGAEPPVIVRFLLDASRGLYDDTPAPHGRDRSDPVIDDRVLRSILTAVVSPGRRYDLSVLPVEVVSVVLEHELRRTIRRSAAHQAVIADSGDARPPGGGAELQFPVLRYLVQAALAAAREGRRRRNLLPLRILDPACGTGILMALVFRDLLDHSPAGPPTAEERREILLDSVYGLDPDPHAVAAARLILLFLLAEARKPGSEEEFTVWAEEVFGSLRLTTRCGDVLIGKAIAHGESWIFCPPRKRAALCPFDLGESFPEIAASGGFDVIVSAPPVTPAGKEEWIREYLQRQYRTYDPRLDRPALLPERCLQLTAPGGILALLSGCSWLRGPAGTGIRELISTRQIREIVEIPGWADGLCLLRLQASPPGKPARVTVAGAGFLSDPAEYVAARGFPVDPAQLDPGGWQFRDTRAGRILCRVQEAGTPLDDVVFGQVHRGIPADERLLLDPETAREWRDRDPASRKLLRPLVRGTEIQRHSAPAAGSLLVIPPGWAEGKAGTGDPWRWLKRRHTFIARHLRSRADPAGKREVPAPLWWETDPGAFWEERRGRILFPARFRALAFLYDTGPAIGDQDTMAIPAAGPFLAAVLNSRFMAFVFDHTVRASAPERDYFSWDDIRSLPVYVPDFDRPEDRDRHARVERLVQRRMSLERSCRAAADEERDSIQKKIRNTDRQIDALVYGMYGLTPEEIALVDESGNNRDFTFGTPDLRA